MGQQQRQRREQVETMRSVADAALRLAADCVLQARCFAAALKGTAPRPSAMDIDDWLTSSKTHAANLAALRAHLAACDLFGTRRT